MTRDEVLEHLCTTVAIVYRTHEDYSYASDGFCPVCMSGRGSNWNFEHSGATLEFVREAVQEKLIREGHHPIDPGRI